MRFATSVFIFLNLWIQAFTQYDSLAASFASTITAYDLKDNLNFIASPSTEGRETGTPGLIRAAEYVASKFGLFGVQQMGGNGTYYQSYKYIRNASKDILLYDSVEKYEFLKDYFVQPDVRNGLAYDKDVIFMGYGIKAEKYNDFLKDTLLTDKIIILMNDEPIHKKKYYLTGTTNPGQWYHNVSLKLAQLTKYKPAAVIVIDDDFKSRLELMKKTLLTETTPAQLESIYPISFPVIYTHLSMAARLLGVDSVRFQKLIYRSNRKHKPFHFYGKKKISMVIDRIASVPYGVNVIGVVEGSDLKNEYIVISAHLDHLGVHQGKIYFGADDDGSGTAALIEIAEAFTIAKRAGHGPRRSILFCSFSGEEKGLLGSEYYVKNPRVPLENTVLDLNIDMIGRIDSVHEILNKPDYIYPIGTNRTSSDIRPLLERCNNIYSHLELDYKYDEPGEKNRYFFRSDHYNFAKNNIPVIFFFTGVHRDYHKSTDTIDKINFEKMQKITRLIFHVAWQAANMNNRPKTDIGK